MANIAIIGTGRMATGLGAGWARTGHQVVFGSRQPQAKAESGRQAGAAVTSEEEALKDAEVVVLAMPFPAVEPFARRHARQLRGKVVVDISNPFQHLPDNRVAGAELTAAAIGEDAHVVAAFKGNFSQTLAEPVDQANGIRRDVLYAGDTEWAKELVARLIADLGFLPIDCGPLQNARILDGMVSLMIELDGRYRGREGRSSWKLLAGLR